MLNIAICDDEGFTLESIKDMLINITFKLGISAEISAFNNSNSILAVITENPKAFDILLLDMYIDENMGLDITRAVREKNQLCAIIFISAFSDKMADSFEHRVSAYLVKPVDQEKLTAAFKTALCHLNIIPSFYLRSKDMNFSIPFHEIMYFESHLKELHLYCKGKQDAMVFTGVLSALAELPTEYFHQCHKSYIVNFLYVRMLDKTKHEIVLDNGRRLPISRSFYKSVTSQFTSFHSKKRGFR